jgi:hypothetical protein
MTLISQNGNCPSVQRIPEKRRHQGIVLSVWILTGCLLQGGCLPPKTVIALPDTSFPARFSETGTAGEPSSEQQNKIERLLRQLEEAERRILEAQRKTEEAREKAEKAAQAIAEAAERIENAGRKIDNLGQKN